MTKTTTKPAAPMTKPKAKRTAKAAPIVAPSANEPTLPPSSNPTAIIAGAPKKFSALDAAFKVLSESATPMNTRAIVEMMAAKGYWSSPGGKTPSATLYSAILREIDTKKEASRFRKVSKGLFEATKKKHL